MLSVLVAIIMVLYVYTLRITARIHVTCPSGKLHGSMLSVLVARIIIRCGYALKMAARFRADLPSYSNLNYFSIRV